MIKYIFVRLFWIFLNLFLLISVLYIISTISMMELMSPNHNGTANLNLVSIRYQHYIKGIFTRWDWGVDEKGKSVWYLFKLKYLVTFKINVFAFLIYVPLGIFLGLISAVKKNTIIDRSISTITLVFSSIPSFIMIFGLIMIFGYALDIVPSLYPPSYASFKVRTFALALPVIALSSEPLAVIIRLIRGELIETLNSDFYLLVKTKGLTRKQAILRHSLRNVMVPILPVLSSTFIYVMGGSFLIERIYNIPGLASWFLNSMVRPFMDTWKLRIDINVIVLICAFYSLISFVFILIVDLLYRFIDPRMKIGSKKAVIE